METIRFVLIIVFVMITMKLWTSWEMTYGTKAEQSQNIIEENVPASEGEGEIPAYADVVEDEGTTPQLIPALDNTSLAVVDVTTDIFQIKINYAGAGIIHAALFDYPDEIDKPDQPFILMDSTQEHMFITQGGILSRQSAPTHETRYQTLADKFNLDEGMEILQVPFTWSGDGVTVTKTYTFKRNSHLVTVKYRIQNDSGNDWSGRTYHQIKRNNPGTGGMRIIYTYTGTVVSDPEDRYDKLTFDDITDDPLARDITDGWIAVIQHYFLTALLPADKVTSHHFYTKDLGNNLFTSGIITPGLSVASGEEKEIIEQIYIGPKDQEKLAAIAEGLDLTVDYGMLWFIAKPLFWALSKIHEKTGNWGWSIILVTICLKIIFYKLSAAGYRSMANMRRVQPRLVSLKERFKDDRVRMNQAMMQIYKEEKINPFGGCFPILIQIPVFIALYWVLLESVELRQAAFILWLHDLSAPDQYYVLPLVMGVTMFIQQKLNPAPIDPVQAKVMMFLPIVFTVFFAFFPSGLVLYWVANNTLSIMQQWLIMRNLEKAGLGTKQK